MIISPPTAATPAAGNPEKTNMNIPTPATVADVPEWLAVWAQSLEENGQLAGAVLRQVAGQLAGQLENLATPAPAVAPDYRADFPAGYNEPGPAADERCIETKLFARKVRRTDAPSWHPNDGADTCDCPECWREESEIVRCVLPAGHDPATMHTGGLACYWQVDPVPSALVDFGAPYATADTLSIPWGSPCDSFGPRGARCVALLGHDGPCWAPDSRHGRIGWDMPTQPESGQCDTAGVHDPHGAGETYCPGKTYPGVPT